MASSAGWVTIFETPMRIMSDGVCSTCPVANTMVKAAIETTSMDNSLFFPFIFFSS
jgi:Fe-S cluster biogenesis protein NfuA